MMSIGLDSTLEVIKTSDTQNRVNELKTVKINIFNIKNIGIFLKSIVFF